MTTQHYLFDTQDAPITAEFKGNLVAQAKAQAASPLQREFAKLLGKIESTGLHVQQLELLLGEFRLKFGQSLPPLRDQHQSKLREMVLFLHDRLQKPQAFMAKAKGLTAQQRKFVARMIISISLDLAQGGDEQMRNIHDLYSPSSMAAMDAQKVSEMHEMLAEMGVDLPPADPQASFEQRANEALKAVAQMMSQEQEQEVQRKARRDQKCADKAKADPKHAKVAKLANKAQAAQEAQGALKSIYRQLARQLHPDRAENDAQRMLNHDLMSQVNTAYERQDLLALLKLQLTAQQIDARSLQGVAEDKLKSWVALLRAQAKELDAQAMDLEMHMRSEFCLHPKEDIQRETLEDALKFAIKEIEIELETCSLIWQWFKMMRASNAGSKCKRPLCRAWKMRRIRWRT